MRISFWYEYGKIDGIGTGHKYRSRMLGEMLKERGHKVRYIEDNVFMQGEDVIIVDHIEPPQDIMDRANRSSETVIVIDGPGDDADVAISAFVNPDAKYKGIKYMAFPIYPHTTKYNPYKKSNDVFVGMGGYDKNNYAEIVAEILQEIGLNAVITKSINHKDLSNRFKNVCVFNEDNYYDAMHECIVAVTNGGLTLFQALHYGMPTVALAQYEHQKINIDSVGDCCLYSESDEESITDNIMSMLGSEYKRECMSRLARDRVDEHGAKRICDIVEKYA